MIIRPYCRITGVTAEFLLVSEEWNHFRRRLLRAEVELLLFMAFGMLLPPQLQGSGGVAESTAFVRWILA